MSLPSVSRVRALAPLLTLSFLAASVQAAPWQGRSVIEDPEWRNRFLGSYGFLSGAEPQVQATELELLREAGFNPLEVIRAAPYHGALQLHKPKGMENDLQFGVLEVGAKADMVVVEENPLENLKVLYGTGTPRLNDDTGEVERVGGITYTIKDGIVYDAQQLLEDVREMVRQARERSVTD